MKPLKLILLSLMLLTGVACWGQKQKKTIEKPAPKLLTTFSELAIFSPDGSKVLTWPDDSTANLWYMNGSLITIFKGRDGTFSPDGSKVLTSRFDGVELWDLNGNLLTNINTRSSFEDTKWITTAEFSPDGTKVLTASAPDWTAKLWDLKGNELTTFRYTSYLDFVTFSPDGSKVFTAYYDSTAKLWDLTGNILTTFRGHSDRVSHAIFSPDGTMVLTGSDDNTAKLWDLNGNVLTTFRGYKKVFGSGTFSPDGSKVLTVSDNNTAKLWDLNGNVLTTFRGYKNVIGSGIFSPDGTKVLTVSEDNTLKLFDLKSHVVSTIQGHKINVIWVSFSPDGSMVLSGSDDYTAKLWDLHGNLLTTFHGHDSPVFHATFSPDGTKVLTSSWDKTAKLWELPPHLRSKPALTFTSKPRYAPMLSIEKIAVIGIGKNNVLDGGEKAIITAFIKNSGKGSAYLLSPTVSASGYDLSAHGKPIAQLLPGASVETRMVLQSPEDLPSGTLELNLEVKEGNKFHAEPTTVVLTTAPFVPPVLQLENYELVGQSTVKLGEKSKVTGLIKNNSAGIAKSVRLVAKFPDNVLPASDITLNLGELGPYATSKFEYEFIPNREFKDKQMEITLSITERSKRFGTEQTLTFDVVKSAIKKKTVIISPKGN